MNFWFSKKILWMCFMISCVCTSFADHYVWRVHNSFKAIAKFSDSICRKEVKFLHNLVFEVLFEEKLKTHKLMDEKSWNLNSFSGKEVNSSICKTSSNSPNEFFEMPKNQVDAYASSTCHKMPTSLSHIKISRNPKGQMTPLSELNLHWHVLVYLKM